MASIIEICNMGLKHIGVKQTIASLDENSNEARVCKAFYENAKNEVLRDHDWPFAKRIVVLALASENPNTIWTYAYR